MDIAIINDYGYKESYLYLNEVIQMALEEEQIKRAVFSVIFVDEETIKKINREYRGVDAVTDVISFALEEADAFAPENCRFLGEIYICIPRMEEQATTYGHSCKRELSFLTVHGILHLLGYDHKTKEEEKCMFSKQEIILNRAGISRE